MSAFTDCPGCGVRLPASGEPVDAERNCSWECWLVRGEAFGFELSQAPLGAFHQLAVDAYAAQHSGPGVRPVGPAFGLAGLYLALVRGRSGEEVRAAHQRMPRRPRDWPRFGAMPAPAALTILDVAEAGVRRGSVAGHAEAVRRWAEAVWAAWAPRQAEVADLTEAALG